MSLQTGPRIFRQKTAFFRAKRLTSADRAGKPESPLLTPDFDSRWSNTDVPLKPGVLRLCCHCEHALLCVLSLEVRPALYLIAGKNLLPRPSRLVLPRNTVSSRHHRLPRRSRPAKPPSRTIHPRLALVSISVIL